MSYDKKEYKKLELRQTLKNKNIDGYIQYIKEKHENFNNELEVWLEVLYEDSKTRIETPIKPNDAWELFIKDFPKYKNENMRDFCSTYIFRVWEYKNNLKIDYHELWRI